MIVKSEDVLLKLMNLVKIEENNFLCKNIV